MPAITTMTINTPAPTSAGSSAVATFELIDDTSLEITPTYSRKIIKGIIQNIDVQADPDPEVVWRAYEACKDVGYELNSPLTGHSALKVQRIVVKGYTTNGALVWITAETPQFGFANPSVLVVSRRSFMSEKQAKTFVDATGSRIPIRTGKFTFPATSGGAAGSIVPDDFASCSYLQPMKSYSVSGIIYGDVPADFDSVFGCVNEDAWEGLPRGFWLGIEADSELSPYQGYTNFRKTAISRVQTNWAETVILIDQRTGRHVPVPSSQITALGDLPYANTLVEASGGGASIFGPYPTTNFAAGFGSY